jgi:hypothetical protein
MIATTRQAYIGGGQLIAGFLVRRPKRQAGRRITGFPDPDLFELFDLPSTAS